MSGEREEEEEEGVVCWSAGVAVAGLVCWLLLGPGRGRRDDGVGDESWMRKGNLGAVASHVLQKQRSDRRFTQSSGGGTRGRPAKDNGVGGGGIQRRT